MHMIVESKFSIALAPSFAGLRRFSEGRNFKQWTGDDSKALMKVCQLLDLTIKSSLMNLGAGLPTGN